MAKKATPADRLRKALEDALVEDPDDRAAHMAYADFLTERGDPRGEFVGVQLALEAPDSPAKQHKELKKREKALLKEHRDQWLGPAWEWLGAKHVAAVRFARGWLDEACLVKPHLDLAKLLAGSAEFRLLRVLRVMDEYPERSFDGGKEYAALHALLKSPYLGNVRRLVIGEPDRDDPIPHPDGSAVADALSRMPRLEELSVCARGVDAGELFRTAAKLERLRTLHLALVPVDNDACAGLAKSGLLRRVKVLRLRGARIGNKGAIMLASCADLRNLERLDLEGNEINKQSARSALARVGISTELKNQGEWETEDEEEDLYEDEWE